MSDQRRYNPNKQQPKEVQDKMIEKDETHRVEVREVVDSFADGSKIPQEIEKNIENIRNVGVLNMDSESRNSPVYDVGRDSNGNTTITGLSNIIQSVEKSEYQVILNTRGKVILDMISNLENEILKLKVDIEVHVEMDKYVANDNDLRRINTTRVESFQKNLEYLINKKEILQTLKK